MNYPSRINISISLFGLLLTFSTQAAISWGETITAGQTEIKADHINEIRTQIQNLETQLGSSGQWVDGAGGDIYYNSGDVGIGTTNPVTKLHITNDGELARFTRSGGQYMQIFNDSGGAEIRSVSTAGNAKPFVLDSTNAGNAAPTAGSNGIRFNIRGSERMRIDNGGNVGIGTPSPSQKLTVEGDITSGGSNTWQFHTPDDGRRNLYFGTASSTAGARAWPINFNNDGTIAGRSFNSTAANAADPIIEYEAGYDLIKQTSARGGIQIGSRDDSVFIGNGDVAHELNATYFNPEAELVGIASDDVVRIYTGAQPGWASAQRFDFNTNGELDIPVGLELGANASRASTETAEIRQDYTGDSGYTQLTINPTIGNATLSANRSYYGINTSMTNNQAGTASGSRSYGYGVRGYVVNSGGAGASYYNAGGTFEGRNVGGGMTHARGALGVARQYDDDQGSNLVYAYGLEGQALGRSSSSTNPGSITHARGLAAAVYPYASNIANADGVNGYISTNNGFGGDITNAYGVRGAVRNDSDDGSDIATAFGGHFTTSKRASASNIGTAYGVYASATAGNTNYGIYSAAGRNYMAETLHINDSTDLSLTSTGHAAIFGPTTGANIGIDGNEIMARNNGAESPLYVQNDGGDFVIHNSQGGGTQFTVKDNGNVGIGTTSPSTGLKLDVEGKVGATEYCDESGGSCTPAANLGGGWTSSGSNIYRTAGSVGIGVNPANRLHINETFAPPSGAGNKILVNSSVNFNPGGGSGGVVSAGKFENVYNGTNGTQINTAFYSRYVAGSSASSTAGVRNMSTWHSVTATNGANLATLLGENITFELNSATVNNAYGSKVDYLSGSNNITNAYGYYAGTMGDATNKFAFYAADSSAKSYFAGNVGIGTTSPTSKLEVAGHITANDTGDSNFMQLWSDNALIAGRNGSLDRIRFAFADNLTAGGFSEKMSLTDSGRLGINNTNPGARLDLGGDMNFRGGNSNTIRFIDNDHDNFLIHQNSGILYFMNDNNDNNAWDDGDDDRIVMRGQANGVHLGIGTNSPTQELHVVGNAQVTGNVRASQYCDENGNNCRDSSIGNAVQIGQTVTPASTTCNPWWGGGVTLNLTGLTVVGGKWAQAYSWAGNTCQGRSCSRTYNGAWQACSCTESNSCRCFVAGTLVHMADGSFKDIEKVVIGDLVMNENMESTVVTALHKPIIGSRGIFTINDKIESTGDHPFQTTEGWKVVNASQFARTQNSDDPYKSFKDVELEELKVGDVLITATGEEVIETITWSDERPADDFVYSFSIANGEGYWADGYLVKDLK